MPVRFRQKALAAVYIPLTVSILIFDRLLPASPLLAYFKYSTLFSLFLYAVLIKKRTAEQKVMSVSFFFLVIGDFFLVLSNILFISPVQSSLFGGLAFFCAYICLTAAYNKKFKIGRPEITTAIPFIILLFFVCLLLSPYIKGALRAGLLIFGLCLCFMAWSAVCTIFRGYYSKKISLLIAVSAGLMLICDFGVGISYYYPALPAGFYPWLKTIVWAAYVPGWMLLDIIISEEMPVPGEANNRSKSA